MFEVVVDTLEDEVAGKTSGLRNRRLSECQLPGADVSLEKLLSQIKTGEEISPFEQAAWFDEKTRVLNRKFFFALGSYLSRKKTGMESGGHYCFSVVDLDYLKAYNHYFGRETGDAAVVDFTNAICQSAETLNKDGILVTRIDGDTFAIVFLGISATVANNEAFWEETRKAAKDFPQDFEEKTEYFDKLDENEKQILVSNLKNLGFTPSGLCRVSLKKMQVDHTALDLAFNGAEAEIARKKEERKVQLPSDVRRILKGGR